VAQQSLFRPQAVTAATGEHSSVSLPVAPLSWHLLGGFILACVAAVVLFLGTAEYARKETAGGALMAAGGAVRVGALRGGVVTELTVGKATGSPQASRSSRWPRARGWKPAAPSMPRSSPPSTPRRRC
jgi:hypothetical protein